MFRFYRIFCIGMLAILLAAGIPTTANAATTYYHVSSSSGNDANNGLSQATPFKTIAKVNTLNLPAGSHVLFKCGDTWRGEMLTITKSGIAGQPITFSSYPAACTNKPILSGAQPISGWTVHSGNIYVANLAAGANAGKFGYGVNQLFRGTARLTLGRWPNIGAADGGYSTIDSMPSSNQIADNQIPAINWTGAVAHIRGMRWYILNRQITASAGQTLTLGAWGDCWGGNCTGWGYFINNHLATLDSEGEWFYDSATGKAYLYTTAGAPANGAVEGSVILKNDTRSWGGITLGEDLTGQGISYVTIDNLDVQRWFRSGIATPTNFANYEPHNLMIKNSRISDADAAGVNLATWVYSASDSRPDGWRGGYGVIVANNVISRVNSMGINLYSRNSIFSENTIQDVGIIQNLGAAGMGCAFDSGGGSCTEDGDGLRIKIDQAADTGNNNHILANRILRTAYNGIDVFGHTNTINNNFISEACIAKGDCGAVRTFGRDNLASSAVHDLTFDSNIIINTLGNTDGCLAAYDALFGFGFYIDNYSKNINITGNTVINSTVHGILLQNSTGAVTSNTLYNNGRTYPYGGAQVYLGGAPAAISSLGGNVLYNLNTTARTLALDDPALLGASNNNAFFSPYNASQISASGMKTFAQWKAFSGKDAASTTHWFTLAPAAAPNSKIFYNDTGAVKVISLGSLLYKDLNQNLVSGSLTLQPFKSKVLVAVVDTTPPQVLSVKKSEASPSTLATVHFAVTFSEPVTGVNAADFSLTTPGITGAAISAVSGSGAAYTVTVTTGTGSGRIRLNVLDNDSIIDVASHPLGGAGAGNGAFSTGEIYVMRPALLQFLSGAAQDGSLLESTETSSVGGTVNAGNVLFALGDDVQNRQYKAVLSFDTSGIPDTAEVVSVRLRIQQTSTLIGKNPFAQLGSLWVDAVSGNFGAAGLSASDFQAAAGLQKAGSFSSTPLSGWYGAVLNWNAYAIVNKTGRTEFRLYFNLDDNNDHVMDVLRFSSGEASSGKPELYVQYLP